MIGRFPHAPEDTSLPSAPRATRLPAPASRLRDIPHLTSWSAVSLTRHPGLLDVGTERVGALVEASGRGLVVEG